MNKTQIMEHLGADDWQWVVDEYAGMDAKKIERALNRMFRDDDNRELAESIYYELHR